MISQLHSLLIYLDNNDREIYADFYASILDT